jgi:prolipoprotein diacylglyceryltransferase
MIPTIIPIDQGGIVVINTIIVVAWLIFSFLFWRGLRHFAVEEDRIFDLTFYSTLAAFIAARAGFVFMHWELFAGKSWLLVAALWVSPGLSWLTGLVGGLAVLTMLSRQYKVRLGLVLDTLVTALPLPIILVLAGSLITGSALGAVTTLPWGIRIGSDVARRHPVELYEMISLIFISLIMVKLASVSHKRKWPYGIVGIWFFLLYAVNAFLLEFVKDARVYWSSLSANQWILIGIFAECIGVLYVRGGGRERLRPFIQKTTNFFTEKGKKLHESVSRRNTQ